MQLVTLSKNETIVDSSLTVYMVSTCLGMPLKVSLALIPIYFSWLIDKKLFAALLCWKGTIFSRYIWTNKSFRIRYYNGGFAYFTLTILNAYIPSSTQHRPFCASLKCLLHSWPVDSSESAWANSAIISYFLTSSSTFTELNFFCTAPLGFIYGDPSCFDVKNATYFFFATAF